MTSQVSIRSIALVGIVLGLASCAPSGRQVNIPNKLPTFRVTGKVLLDGKPGAFITVKLIPVTPLKTGGYESAAITDANGEFEISTYGLYDGAPAAEYALTFERRKMIGGRPGQDELGGRYATVQHSPKEVVVEEGENEIDTIELSTK